MKIIFISIVMLLLCQVSSLVSADESIKNEKIQTAMMSLNLKMRLSAYKTSCHYEDHPTLDVSLAVCEVVVPGVNYRAANTDEHIIRQTESIISKITDWYVSDAVSNFEIRAVTNDGEEICDCIYSYVEKKKSCIPFEGY